MLHRIAPRAVHAPDCFWIRQPTVSWSDLEASCPDSGPRRVRCLLRITSTPLESSVLLKLRSHKGS